ncbi:uncharacterized protein STEHIDRAFT_123044 [Stereum hirsutum FP-91666 SS1]|uniref:uncharacterized protein n=1 Tax=Stereum hirsutum (strain FP-91666) TaxID=721885 RepID=UPI0004449BD9|nr:uncharacterized protein STEHIDRAFT_123044 [Stereum hirsutum FP-91666 SS1]EIM84182.1 hypothetical protein STEHIDRAFT_123044 [Stereum hirsutum FP-91666 SS1]
MYVRSAIYNESRTQNCDLPLHFDHLPRLPHSYFPSDLHHSSARLHNEQHHHFLSALFLAPLLDHGTHSEPRSHTSDTVRSLALQRALQDPADAKREVWGTARSTVRHGFVPERERHGCSGEGLTRKVCETSSEEFDPSRRPRTLLPLRTHLQPHPHLPLPRVFPSSNTRRNLRHPILQQMHA